MKSLLREAVAASPIAPRLEAMRLVDEPRFAAAIEALATKLSLSKAQVRRRAVNCLREMVTLDSRAWTWAFDHLLGPAHTQAFTVQADSAALEKLKALNATRPLVLLPCHRSYADFFLTSKTLLAHGLQRTHTLGGDNLRFFPMEPIAQHSGGIFIRRSFKDDEVYKAMLREYLTHLVGRGENLEWYMEGGRSRTGKLRPPKYGLLTYLVHAIRSGAAPDVLLVPTSITYDQLHEVRAMMQQEHSGHKPKEGLPWLLSYARTQRQWVGEVHIRFGEPISLKARMEAADAGEGDARWLVEKTAFKVFERINEATPVTRQALVTLALLVAGGRSHTLDEVQAQLLPLLDYADARRLPTSELRALRSAAGLLETLSTLVRTGVVERYEATEPVFRIAPGQHAVAAYYRNSALHWFILRAILELAMFTAARSGQADPAKNSTVDLVAAGRQETLALRDLLKFEFIFPDRAGFRTALLTESDLFDPKWRERLTTAETRLAMIAEAPLLIAPTVLPTFLEAYWVLAECLAEQPVAEAVDKAQLIESCMNIGRQYVLQQRLHHPECLSRELFGSALLLADNRGLLKPGDAELATARRGFERQCAAALAQLRALAGLRAAATPAAPSAAALEAVKSERHFKRRRAAHARV